MEIQKSSAAKPCSRPIFKSIFTALYHGWQQHRMRISTKKALYGLSDAQLKDIGLTWHDVRYYK